jgi:hypothetical protein
MNKRLFSLDSSYKDDSNISHLFKLNNSESGHNESTIEHQSTIKSNDEPDVIGTIRTATYDEYNLRRETQKKLKKTQPVVHNGSNVTLSNMLFLEPLYTSTLDQPKQRGSLVNSDKADNDTVIDEKELENYRKMLGDKENIYD